MPPSDPRPPITINPTADLPGLPGSPALQALWQDSLGWQPNPSQQHQFQQLYHAVLQGNQAFNLTRITESEEFWEKHLWDSLSGIRMALSPSTSVGDKAVEPRFEVAQDSAQASPPRPLHVIDIGTGAGFPGIPVAIARPDWQVTLLDSTRKKMAFLDTVLSALDISNAQTLTARVEALGHDPNHRSQYDLALLRAVAPAPVCAEYALPLLNRGGLAVLYRGLWTDSETQAIQSVVQKLGGELQEVTALKTPLSGGDRHCVMLRKMAPTPDTFPRGIGIPTKDPLQ